MCLLALYHLRQARISPAIGFVLQCLSMVSPLPQYEWVATVNERALNMALTPWPMVALHALLGAEDKDTTWAEAWANPGSYFVRRCAEAEVPSLSSTWWSPHGPPWRTASLCMMCAPTPNSRFWSCVPRAARSLTLVSRGVGPPCKSGFRPLRPVRVILRRGTAGPRPGRRVGGDAGAWGDR